MTNRTFISIFSVLIIAEDEQISSTTLMQQEESP